MNTDLKEYLIPRKSNTNNNEVESMKWLFFFTEMKTANIIVNSENQMNSRKERFEYLEMQTLRRIPGKEI